MPQHKFRVADVPDNCTIHHYVQSKFQLERYWQMPIANRPPRFFKYEIQDFDLDACIAQADAICEQVGWHGFASYTKQSLNRSANYGGFSVSYNPWKKDVSIYQSSLGDVKWNLGNVFTTPEGIRFYKWLEDARTIGKFYGMVAKDGMEVARVWAESHGFTIPREQWVDAGTRKEMVLRNSYYDTWRFNKVIPEMREGAFGTLLDQIKRPFVRSRCAYIRPEQARSGREKEYLWHRDEFVFVNFRLNIPLRTNDNFFLEDQIKGRYDFRAGHGYSWNTEDMHRATWTEGATGERSALVIGTNPWFDYVEEEDAFVSNEFFGEMHPFDMLVNGHIINLKSITME